MSSAYKSISTPSAVILLYISKLSSKVTYFNLFYKKAATQSQTLSVTSQIQLHINTCENVPQIELYR